MRVDMWKRSSVTSSDVDVAELYDGFTHIAMAWVEAMGLCGVGEFGDWVDGGKTIGPGGSLPLNTSGANSPKGGCTDWASSPRAIAQLRGECGPAAGAGRAGRGRRERVRAASAARVY